MIQLRHSHLHTTEIIDPTSCILRTMAHMNTLSTRRGIVHPTRQWFYFHMS